MAIGRGGGPPDIKGTLGTLLRTTLNQMAALRDAVERGARTQRGWLDSALLSRQRKDVLASLGEVVYQLAVSGELGDLDEFPEVGRLIYDLEDIDAQIEQTETELTRRTGRRSPREVWGRPPRDQEDPGEYRVWRPVDPDAESAPEASNPESPVKNQAKRRGGRRRASRSSGGGIQFVEDGASQADEEAELAEYMHEDDVAPPASGSEDD